MDADTTGCAMMLIRWLLAAMLAWTTAQSGAVAADSPAFTPAQRNAIVTILREALQRDPSILRDATTALQADDARRQAEATRALIAGVRDRLVTPADPVAGNPFATTTLVVFFDTRCPYCRQLMPTLADLVRADPGVRVIYKDLPILGPSSVLESRALLSAQGQGGYFKLLPVLMSNTTPANRDTLRADADRVGLDGGQVVRNMDDPAIKARLDANMALARELNLEGTPAIIAGDHLIPGAMESADLRQLVADVRAGK